ncbi:MAG: T9SS type A sorting domain-containing protein [Lewinellaceae bacterium]|nr:T9SS type A sorting domain-containing protein [Saprospiraceae bacterium]MCB9339722.1 T9SS type A sorting domain-containing protein [Lewinellaceae bacterium]
MKKTLLLLTMFLPCLLLAQPDPLPDTAFTNGNGIRALINANGALFHDFQKGQFLTDETGRSLIRAAGVWIGGLDKGGGLKVSAQLYNEDGRQDFVPGMANLSKEENLHWNKVWRVRAEDAKYHWLYYLVHQAVKDTLPSIFGWPGKGNRFFKQFNGFDLPNDDMPLAPFKDRNLNGIYEPEKGDSPMFAYEDCNSPVFPNEILWYTFHDNIEHTESAGSIPLMMTVQNQVSTFKCIDNKVASEAVVLHYRLINNALEDIDSCYFGIFTDFQIGCPDDDYIGSIPAASIVYAYNADDFDEDCGAFKGYGEHPSALALKLIWGPYNEFHKELPLSTLMVLPENPPHTSGQGMPTLDYEFYHYLSGRWKDGTRMTTGGDGYNPLSTDYTTIAYPGLPTADTTNWTEPNAGNLPGRRKVIASFGPFSLQPGAINQLLLAFTYFPNESKDNIKIVDEINFYLHHTFDFIYSGCDEVVFPGCETNIEIPPLTSPLTIAGRFEIRPNPASDELRLLFRDEKAVLSVEIHDFLGRKVFENHQASDVLILDVSNWPVGAYTAIVRQGKERSVQPFIVMRP